MKVSLKKCYELIKKEKAMFISIIVVFIPTIFTLFSQTRDNLVIFFKDNYSIPTFLSEFLVIILILLPISALSLIWFIIITQRRNKTMIIAIDNDSRGQRIEDFQVLRENAKKDILIMGIGMSAVSSDDSIKKLVKKGIDVKFLIMDPDILINANPLLYNEKDEQKQKLEKYKLLSSKIKDQKMLIDAIDFDNYYKKTEYRRIIETSIKNIKKMISEQKKTRDGKDGEIELRKYSYHIAMNVTISDIKTEDSKMVAEFCLPFTNERIRTKLDKGQVKDLIENQILQLWSDAKLIDRT